jgi:hypothetical protein
MAVRRSVERDTDRYRSYRSRELLELDRKVIRMTPTQELEEPDPQRLLPEELRPLWAVVPKALLYQMVLVGALLGAGAATSAYAFLLGEPRGWYAFPLAIGLAWLQNRFPWGRRAVYQLRDGSDGVPDTSDRSSRQGVR